MNTETTTDRTGVMIPKWAKARRIQTTWYNSPQNPDRKKSANTIVRSRDIGRIVLKKNGTGWREGYFWTTAWSTYQRSSPCSGWTRLAGQSRLGPACALANGPLFLAPVTKNQT